MNCVWLFLSSLLYLAKIEYQVNGLALDDLDFARSTIESAAKSITSKPSLLNTKSIKDTHGHVGERGWFLAASVSESGILEEKEELTTKKVPTTKPRNLNKFNEAMDQVERAMTQAELSRKIGTLTDLKKDIIDAVNRGNIG